MAAPRKQSESTSLAIWGDIKTFLTAGLLLCCLPFGLIMMWSWGIWSGKVRKIVTWLAVLAVAACLAALIICGSHFRKACGSHWGKSCGIHQKYGHDSHARRGGGKRWGEYRDWKNWDHDDDDDDAEEEE